VRLSDQPTDTPSGAVEVLSGGTNGESKVLNLGGQGGDTGKGTVVETVVYFVGEDDDVILDTELTNRSEFLFTENLSDRVVTGFILA
jgi:phage/plasmid-associated DNA primase